MDHLCELPHDAARRKALNTLPPTLHATYERILQRINKSNKDVQQLVQRSLRWLVCSKANLSSEALCQAISIETGDTDLDRNRIPEESEILRRCSSLVRRTARGDGLELAHFTVKEFLMTGIDSCDQEFQVYHYGLEDDEVELAEKCLTFLCFQGYKGEGSSDRRKLLPSGEAHSFRQYAVRYWPDHARKHLSKPVVSSLTQKLLDPSKQHTFITWAEELRLIVRSDYGENAEDADLSKASPLHFASMLVLPKCCEWLLQAGCYINESSVFGTPLECALLGDIALLSQARLRIPTKPPSAAIAESRSTTVGILVGNDADVNRSFLGQPSPMYIALCMADKLSCIELLRKGALIDSNAIGRLSGSDGYDLAREICEAIDTTSLRPKDHAILLQAALRSGNFSGDVALSVLAHRSEDTLNTFLTAAEYGQLGIVETIAQSELNINAVRQQDQRSALHLAASNDHIDIVRFLVEHGADCSLVDSEGRTPLHTSVEKLGCYRCFDFLLSRKVDVNSGDKHGLTVWHLAASKANIHALNILRSFAANGPPQLHLKANDGRTLLHCAAQSSSRATLIFLKDHFNQSAFHQTTSEGLTALHYAVKANSLDAVQYLIDREFDIHAITNDGSNTLHCTVDHDSSTVCEIVEMLLKNGVDPCKARKDGMTPIDVLLSIASQSTYSPDVSNEFGTILRILAKHSSLDITDGAGLTPLHRVCQIREDTDVCYQGNSWRPDALKILLQSGAKATVQDSMGKTALVYLVEAWKERLQISSFILPFDLPVIMIMELLDSTNDEHFLSNVCADPQILCLALISGNEELAYKVLEHGPSVDATVYDISGLSSLEAACKHGCSRPLLEELLGRSKVDRGIAGSKFGLSNFAFKTTCFNYERSVTNLLDLGFDPNDCTTEGKSALMLAAERGDIAVVEILINHGADVSATDNNGWSVIHYALESGSEALWHLLRRLITDWNAVIAADFSGRWSRDATALHLAASLWSGALDFLLKNSLISDINYVTDLQETALYIAVFHEDSRNVELLLEANADTTLSACGQESPLHLAARFGFIKIVKVFASKGTNLLLQDSSGLTPELIARRNGHFDIAKFLKEERSAGIGNRSFPNTTFRTLSGDCK